MDINTVDSLVWPDFDVTKGRDFDMTMWGWSATMQLFPSRLVELFHSDLSLANVNIGAFGNEEFDRTADELRVTMDEDARKDLINKLQAIISNEYPIIPLYYENIVNAYDKTVFSGWEFRSGTGIINKLSFISEASAQPPDTTPAPAPKDDSGSSSMLWLFIVAAVVKGDSTCPNSWHKK
jgi:peptide/nickel transport system substrate-binding protein